jgi:large subunit ribosomal protein L35
VAAATCSHNVTLSTSARKSHLLNQALWGRGLPPAAPMLGRACRRAVRPEPVQQKQESQMPKLKTKSGAKKRFKVTATGKVLFAQSGKRHGMIKRTNKQIRDHRGTAVMFKTDGDRIKQYWLPND